MIAAQWSTPWHRLATALAVIISSAGCMSVELPKNEPSPERAEVSPPAGPLVYQPAFLWTDGKITQQGTGFFARKQSGEIVGITSAHFIDFDGPALEQALWLNVESGRSVAQFQQSFGTPGRALDRNTRDRRLDYLILFDPNLHTELPVLELDFRLQPNRRERIWLPDKRPKSRDGCVLIEGTVTDASEEYCIVRLDENLELRSQSGSPIISQKTGKVIGTLSRGGQDQEGVYLWVAPAHALLKAMRDAKSRPLLRDVVGKLDRKEADLNPAHRRQVPIPTGQLVFDASWNWSDGQTRQDGTGFFVETPAHEIVGIASLRLLESAQPSLLAANLLELTTGKSRAEFNRSLGSPIAMQADGDGHGLAVVVLTDDTPVYGVPCLALDDRMELPIGERLWFPWKDASSRKGCRLVEGVIAQSSGDTVAVEIGVKVAIDPGTPAISQTTGKVIGIADQDLADDLALLIPLMRSRALQAAISTQSRQQLSEALRPRD